MKNWSAKHIFEDAVWDSDLFAWSFSNTWEPLDDCDYYPSRTIINAVKSYNSTTAIDCYSNHTRDKIGDNNFDHSVSSLFAEALDPRANRKKAVPWEASKIVVNQGWIAEEFEIQTVTVSGNGKLVGDIIEKSELGGEYLGWTGLNGWEVQAGYLGIHHIRWPAGNIAEDRIEDNRYAFDLSTPTLVDNWPKWNGSPREGLAEMFAVANELQASFSLIVPSGRYVELMEIDPSAARMWIESDIALFTERLYSGEFGTIPEDFIVEIGAEYYSTDAWDEHIGNPDIDMLFAQVFAELVAAFSAAEERYGEELFKIAVQSARFQSPDDIDGERNGEQADAEEFIAAFKEKNLEGAIDAIIWHRYIYTFEQASHHLEPSIGEQSLSDHHSYWESALGHPLDLILGWAAPDVDSNGEYPDNPHFDYGPRSAHTMLQMFSQLSEAEVDYATLYGIDSPWTGAVTTGTTSPDSYTVYYHGELYRMMAESLPGLRATDAFHQNYVSINSNNDVLPMNHVNTYGFTDTESRQVTFLAAWELLDAEINVEVASPDSFHSEMVALSMIRPGGWDSFSEAVASVSNAHMSDDSVVRIEGVTDFSIVRVEHYHDASHVELSREFQVLLSATSGRRYAALSARDDTFNLLDGEGLLLNAGLGDDTITGQNFRSYLVGGGGNDVINGGADGDVIVGDVLLDEAILDWLSGEEEVFY